mgnify:CR=1 FL=1
MAKIGSCGAGAREEKRDIPGLGLGLGRRHIHHFLLFCFRKHFSKSRPQNSTIVLKMFDFVNEFSDHSALNCACCANFDLVVFGQISRSQPTDTTSTSTTTSSSSTESSTSISANDIENGVVASGFSNIRSSPHGSSESLSNRLAQYSR